MSKDKNQKQLQISFEEMKKKAGQLQISFEVEVFEFDLRMTGLEEHIITLDHEDYSDEVRNMIHTETLKILASMEKEGREG